MAERKTWPGHCWVTGNEIHEIKRQFPADHPRAGEPMQIGAVLPSAVQVDLVLVSGKRMSLTVDESALPIADHVLPPLWRSVIMANVEEVERARVVNRYTPEQVAAHRRMLLKSIVNDPPLGVVSCERVVDRARRQQSLSALA